MPKSNAQRQREYRQRHLNNLSEETVLLERLNMMVDCHAKAQLKRLACCYGVTQRMMLEQVISEAARALMRTLSHQQQEGFYNRTLSLRRNTQEVNLPPMKAVKVDGT